MYIENKIKSSKDRVEKLIQKLVGMQLQVKNLLTFVIYFSN